MNGKIFFVGTVIVVVGAAGVFFLRGDRMPYDLATAKKGTIVQEISASGSVEPTTRVDLQFKNSGEIAEIRVEVGQMVKTGDMLAKQDTSVLVSQLRQSAAELSNQEYKLATVTKNEAEKTDEEQNLIKAQKSIVEKALSDMRVQKAKIDESTLVSPIDGVVTAVNGGIGEIAKPETIVVSVISADAPHIEVDVPETAVAKLAAGQKARITLDAFGDDVKWVGNVTKIDPAEIVKGGAVYYRTTVLFEREDSRVRPGMTANVWIETDVVEDAVLVPASAVQKKDGKKVVRVLRDGNVAENAVTVGVKNDDGMIEIISGISDGDQVIIGDK